MRPSKISKLINDTNICYIQIYVQGVPVKVLNITDRITFFALIRKKTQKIKSSSKLFFLYILVCPKIIHE